jgi:hypothetical protein
MIKRLLKAFYSWRVDVHFREVAFWQDVFDKNKARLDRMRVSMPKGDVDEVMDLLDAILDLRRRHLKRAEHYLSKLNNWR